MPRTTAAIVLLSFVAFFGAQLVGVHSHIDSHGFDGPVQSALGHHHDDGDEHHGDVDVRVSDLGIGASKMVFVAFAVALTLFLLAPSRSSLTFDRKTPLPASRRLRWRPPLRAPPR